MMPLLSKARVPTFYFIGVTTGQSSNVVSSGRKLALNDANQRTDVKYILTLGYIGRLLFIKEDPLSRALVTTHKIDYMGCFRHV